MNRLIRSAAFALMLFPAMGSAQDFDVGLEAYEVGDYATALREWTPLAEQGDMWAQKNLGIMYEYGQGVPQDYAEAVKWYRLAADQGHADAQTNLGVMYATGEGVPQDYVTAHMWFNIGAANGDTDAATNRDKVAAKMLPADISEAQRRAKVCMASGYQDCD
ncbi:Sel1-like repeat [Paracoccaceae bacterium]